jgi:hypothetical protein
MEQFFADFNMLRGAGLDISPQLEGLPEALVLKDSEMFQAKLLELTAAVPVMLSSGGVQPYTNGMPRNARELRSV